MKRKRINGSLCLKDIEFNEILKRKAIKNNNTSAKITLPKEMTGKEVFVFMRG